MPKRAKKRSSRRSSRGRRSGDALRDARKPWWHATFVEEMTEGGRMVWIFRLNDDEAGYLVKMPAGTGGFEEKTEPDLRSARREAKNMLASRRVGHFGDARRGPMPRIEYDGVLYVLRSRSTVVPDLASMRPMAAYVWLNQNTVPRGRIRDSNPLAGLAGVVDVKVGGH